MKEILRFICCFLLSLISSACHSKTIADRCVAVDLQQEKGDELIPLLQNFAKKHGLEEDRSNPISPRWIRGPKERSIAEVKYRMGFGEFGALLLLYRFDSTTNVDLVMYFDAFIKTEVSPKYGITNCSDLPNFKAPEIYR